MQQPNRKEIILAIFTVAAGGANAYLWREALAANGFKDAAFYSLPVLALFAFAILFSLSSTLIRERWLRMTSAALALASGFLSMPSHSAVFTGAILSSLGAAYAGETIANDNAASSMFSVRKVLKSGLPVFFTTVALVLAVFYFSSLGVAGDQSLLPKGLFDAVVPLIEQPLQGILPGFRSDASVDQLILAFAAGQAGGGLDPTSLPAPARAEFLREGRETLGREFGIAVTGREKGLDVLYQVANAQIEKFVGPYRSYLPFLAAFGFFLAVKTFTLPVYWITLILVFAVVKLLVKAGVLRQRTDTVQVTRIVL